MQKKIGLKLQEVTQLQTFTHTGTAAAREITRAKILLASNEGKTDQEICAMSRLIQVPATTSESAIRRAA